MRSLLIVILIFIIPAYAKAELYKWVDSNGGTFFVDDLSKVPSEYRSRAQKIGQSADEPASTRTPDKRGGYVANPVQVDNNGRPESWWRNKANDLRKQIQQYEELKADAYEQYLKCEESQQNIIGRGRRNCAGVYEDQKKNWDFSIEKVKRKLEVDLPEEARKAGAYPGWVRE